VTRAPKIISGGQTGVDRAALDAARGLGLPYGGFVPHGRWTEKGPLPDKYEGMVETQSRKPAPRTKRNVEEADATLIITRGECAGGTLLTLEIAQSLGRPHLVIDLDEAEDPAAQISDWIRSARPKVLNIAGPRASKDAEIYAEARAVLTEALRPFLASG